MDSLENYIADTSAPAEKPKAETKQMPNGLNLTNEQLALSNRSVKLYKGILNHEKETGKATLELGECLSNLREQLGHGKWGEYCKAFAHVYSDRTIRRYIQVYKNRTLVSDLKTQHEMFLKLGMVREVELPEDDSDSSEQPQGNDPNDGKGASAPKPQRKPPKKKSVYLTHIKKLNEVPESNLSPEETDQIIREGKPFLDWAIRQSAKHNLPTVQPEI